MSGRGGEELPPTRINSSKMGVTTVYSSLRSIWKKTGFAPTFMSQTVQHGISLMLIMRHGHRRTLTHRCPTALAA